jgi:hypothetical protein
MKAEIRANNEKMDAWIAEMGAWRNETTACQETTEACLESKEPTSLEVGSEVVGEEVLTEDTAVKPVGALRKQYRGHI